MGEALQTCKGMKGNYKVSLGIIHFCSNSISSPPKRDNRLGIDWPYVLQIIHKYRLLPPIRPKKQCWHILCYLNLPVEQGILSWDF
jgi:hypothetical protein